MKLIKKFPTLYKTSVSGKIQIWNIEVFNDNVNSIIKTSWGFENGEIQEAFEIIKSGKNIGKINETTTDEQAMSQAQSKWEKQKRYYYAESIKDSKNLSDKLSRPMLAHKWQDRKHKLQNGQKLIVQPKMDGMRCIAICDAGKVTLLSRGQKEITSVPHIVKELESIMDDGSVWDGELYNDNLSFEELMSLARKKAPAKNHEDLELHLFDIISDGTFRERWADLISYINTDIKKIKLIDSKEILYNEDIIADLLYEAENNGFEGIILRDPESKYEHKRSNSLLKVKSFQDHEYVVIGCEMGTPGTKKDGLLEVFVMKTKEGHEFRAPLMGTDENKRIMWKNQSSYIGKMATVVFQQLSNKGIPRFPKVKYIRDENV